MTNTSLTYAKDIGEQILCILDNKKTKNNFCDYLEIVDFISSILMFFEICCSCFLLCLTIKNMILNSLNLMCFINFAISCAGIGGIYYLIKKIVKHNKKFFHIKEFVKVWAPKSILGAISMFFLLLGITLIYLING